MVINDNGADMHIDTNTLHIDELEGRTIIKATQTEDGYVVLLLDEGNVTFNATILNGQWSVDVDDTIGLSDAVQAGLVTAEQANALRDEQRKRDDEMARQKAIERIAMDMHRFRVTAADLARLLER